MWGQKDQMSSRSHQKDLNNLLSNQGFYDPVSQNDNKKAYSATSSQLKCVKKYTPSPSYSLEHHATHVEGYSLYDCNLNMSFKTS